MAFEKEITIYDLADQLKLSPSTISRALNDHPAINAQTKEKIRLAAQKMGYQLNRFAQNLRTQSTKTIGVIVPRLDSAFMSTVLAGMERVLSPAGYNMLIMQSQESEQKEIFNANSLYNSRVDGLMVSVSVETTNWNHYDAFIKKNVPVLFFDRLLDSANTSSISIDNKKAGFDATEHLISKGCKNIWHIGGNVSCGVYKDRMEGYLNALSEYKVEHKSGFIIEDSLSLENVHVVAETILDSENRPDGLFVANDNFAANLIVSLIDAGIKIPEEIKIVGFNNDPVCQVVTPRLSSIHYPGEDLGEMAAESLINQLNGKIEVGIKQVLVLGHKLIIRASSTG